MRGTMGDMQHFCLRWNNYQSSITSAFENLRDDEDFVDVTLACDGKSLKAHRVVLSACSPYFRELLKSTPCKHPVIVLQDVMFEDLHALVEFIYHGEVNVRQRSLSSFLKTAEVLRVSGLTQQSGTVSMGFDKTTGGGVGAGGGGSGTPVGSGGGLTDGRGSPLSSTTASGRRSGQARQRDTRPLGTPDNLDSPDTNPMKKPKNEPLVNHYPERSPPTTAAASDIEEPPMDFSTTSNNNNNNNNNNIGSHRDKSEAGSPAGSDLVKPEPIELTPHQSGVDRDDSGDSGGELESVSGGLGHLGGLHSSHQGGGPLQVSDHDDSIQSAHQLFDSKLFAAAASPGFQFSMAAALAADSLAGLNNQAHGLGSADGLAGSSQQGAAVGWVIPRSAAHATTLSNTDPATSSLTSSSSSSPLTTTTTTMNTSSYICDICHKRYRTISSLRNHKSVYHRQNRQNTPGTGQSGQDKRYQTDRHYMNPPTNYHFG